MKYIYVVIGAGAAGLVVATGLAKFKKKVLLIEKSYFGGDCTNFGCIPSKSLIAASKIANDFNRKNEFGINIEGNLDFSNVLKNVRDIVEKTRKKEDEIALKKLGVDTLKATAAFLSPNKIEVTQYDSKKHIIEFKKLVIAAGSSPFIPPIPNLDKTPFLTNETIFNLKNIPKSLIVLGSGAIGCELSQAFQRLGCQVSIVDIKDKILFNESQQTSDLLKDIFFKENISLYLSHTPKSVNFKNNEFIVEISKNEKTSIIKADQLLIATGRKPSFSSLNLDNAKIKHTNQKIIVDKFSRTNQKHIYAIGDIIGPPYFTHVAEHQARAVLLSLILPLGIKKAICIKHLPKVTFTNPEIASIGMNEIEAIEKYGDKHILSISIPIDEIDRSITQREKNGFINIVVKKFSSKILGATIVAERAGEILSEIYLAMNKNIKLKDLANIIHPYPTYNIGIRKAADLWYKSFFRRKK